MKELQARIQAIRTLQTEMNLARQPDSELLSPNEPEIRNQAKLVEMPERVLEEKPVTRSRRKSQPSSKRKASASAAQQKAPVPFRQLRENQEPLPPFADDLKRLEAQAERINQVLAERSQNSVSLEHLEGADESENGDVAINPPVQAQPPKKASGRSPSARKKTAKGAKQTEPSDDEGEVSPMSALEDEEADHLKAQAERINRLLAELEETIREAGTMAGESHRKIGVSESGLDERKRQAQGDRRPPPPPQAFYESHPPVYAQGNLKKAVQEAAQTAQALRYLSHRDHPDQLDTTSSQNFTRSRVPSPHRPPIKRLGLRLRGLFQVPRKPLDRLGDAFLWIVIAAVLRVGSRFLIMTYPAYTPLIMILMLAPAAGAVYLALFVPRAGFVSVYRLFLIMLGLLLGGKL